VIGRVEIGKREVVREKLKKRLIISLDWLGEMGRQ
jgi:hypothetical protein